MSSKPRVLLARAIPQSAMDILAKECEVFGWLRDDAMPRAELLKQVRGAHGLFCHPSEKIDQELLDAGPELRAIGTMSVGSDHIDKDACRKRGVTVGFTGDALTETVAEWAVALLLATSRRLVESNRAVHSGAWGGNDLLWMCGRGLRDSVVGIVGLGQIGAAFARLLPPFKPKEILYFSRSAKEQVEAEFVGPCALRRSTTLEELLRASDFVVCAASLNASTEGLFGEAAFRAMKHHAVFVNITRGAVVDQEALYEALTSEGGIGAAGLDVTTPEPLPTDHPLLALTNCVVTPHLGAATTATRTAIAELTARNILAGLRGQPLPASLL